MPAWDSKQCVTNGDWIRAGMGTHCTRCGYETTQDGGYAIGDDAICEDCMTLADWDIVDPEWAAEFRGDFHDDD